MRINNKVLVTNTTTKLPRVCFIKLWLLFMNILKSALANNLCLPERIHVMNKTEMKLLFEWCVDSMVMTVVVDTSKHVQIIFSFISFFCLFKPTLFLICIIFLKICSYNYVYIYCEYLCATNIGRWICLWLIKSLCQWN